MASVDAKETKTVSIKQLQANRRNAAKSTGPCTDEGKARASGNAVTHGVFCRDLLLPGEDPAELAELRRGIYLSQSPQDVMECELVDRIVDAQWRLRRLRGSERAVLAGDDARPRGYRTPAQRSLDRAVRQAQKAGMFDLFRAHGWDPDAAEEEIDAVVEEDHAPPAATAPAPAAALTADFRPFGSGTIERLSRYQQRLEQSVHRALRELRQLRKDRAEREEEPRSTYLAELEPLEELEQRDANDKADDGAAGEGAGMCQIVPSVSNVQNEPIWVASPAAPDAAEGCAPPSRAMRRSRPGDSGITLPGAGGGEDGVI